MENAEILDELKKKLTISKGQTIPYDDAILMGNFVKASNDDITQTSEKVAKYGAGVEQNPMVRPFVSDANVFRGLGLLGQAALLIRWANMQNEQQKKTEEILSNVIEAAALNYSKEPFTLSFGMQF